ncbi:MAG: 3-methyl-2-oxobutanoate hydroxymethyltransferase [Thermaerobacter sp.]|nr:3-methyl-2-oxobutanoate hydroxymethyltransferase [Thermaerobacter sp.]
MTRGRCLITRNLTIPGLKARKGGIPLTWITAYDVLQAQVAEASQVDVILVGDSLGMTTLGYSTTLPVTVDDMIHHARAVRRGAPNTMMVVDLPFMSYALQADAVHAAGRVMQETEADAVKLEGGREVLATVEHLVAFGIPVVGHLGLTPQSVHEMGGYKVQAKTADTIRILLQEAGALTAAGICALVLEGIPDRVAAEVTNSLPIPTIGIGAGPGVDGQVLVFHDCLGLSTAYPKFVRPFAQVRTAMTNGLTAYREAVQQRHFPGPDQSYQIADAEWERHLADRGS